MRRLRQWIFRLQKEYKVSSSAYFITLTYDTQNVPLSKNLFMTLDKSDVQKFFKRLRKREGHQNIKYYLVGEYGTKNKRPHYHAIIFNLDDIENVHREWGKGDVHHGTVTVASIAYTLEYMTKQSDVTRHDRDDRVFEFSLFSKGLGKSYLYKNDDSEVPDTEAYQFHRKNPLNMYITIEDGTRIPMPRYYRQRIWNEKERAGQAQHIGKVLEELYYKELEEKGERQMDMEKKARVQRLNFKKTKKL